MLPIHRNCVLAAIFHRKAVAVQRWFLHSVMPDKNKELDMRIVRLKALLQQSSSVSLTILTWRKANMQAEVWPERSAGVTIMPLIYTPLTTLLLVNTC
ncbi:hypothetical protein EMCRGX_G010239 [Ephydatia muelleri]